MPLPENEKTISDVLAFVTEGSKELVDVKDVEGNVTKQLVLNTKKIYYKGQLVNSQTFSRFVLELEQFALMADECFNNMAKPRAIVFARQIKAYVMSYMYSIDAKSSESVLDKNNTQNTLLHSILRNSVERKYTINEEAKNNIFASIFSRDKSKDAAEG